MILADFLVIAGKKPFKHFHEDERWEISEPLTTTKLSIIEWLELTESVLSFLCWLFFDANGQDCKTLMPIGSEGEIK